MADALLPLAVKLLWDESLPLRRLIYSKLPFAKDAAKKKLAEEELGKLLEDTHKLAKSLAPAQADEAIDKRIELFRQDLIRAHIPADQAEVLVERGGMFVRMLVTEPISEISMIKLRLTETEKALEALEAKAERQNQEIQSLQEQIKRIPRDPHILALWVGLAVLLVLGVVQLAILLTHTLGGSH